LPNITLAYSTILPTNQDVTVTLTADPPVTMLNSEGTFSHTFTENGAYTFLYKDGYGRKLTKDVKVENIDKTAPTAAILLTPEAKTADTTATFVLGGEQVVAYRYNVDGSDFGAMVEVAKPIGLTDLGNGSHTVGVLGCDLAGNCQDSATATSFSWEILSANQVRKRTTPLEKSVKAIEVSIEEQHLWAYDGNELFMETAITSGMSARGLATETGDFKITQKHEDKYFEGGYFSHYWMRFNKGMGIHDASWRRDFGSQNYKWTGSHGCVNMPVPLMPAMYEWAEIGTSVVVY
jgi:hypothetical protein